MIVSETQRASFIFFSKVLPRGETVKAQFSIRVLWSRTTRLEAVIVRSCFNCGCNGAVSDGANN